MPTINQIKHALVYNEMKNNQYIWTPNGYLALFILYDMYLTCDSSIDVNDQIFSALDKNVTKIQI